MYARLEALETGQVTLEAKAGAASELAADAAMWAKEARKIAASNMRQSCKVYMHLNQVGRPNA